MENFLLDGIKYKKVLYKQFFSSLFQAVFNYVKMYMRQKNFD